MLNLENAVWSRAMNRLAHARGAKVMLTGTFGNLTPTSLALVDKRRLVTVLDNDRHFAR